MRRRPETPIPLALLLLALTSCGGAPRTPIAEPTTPGQAGDAPTQAVADAEPGLQLTLTTLPSSAPTTRTATVAAEPLPDAQARALLARLPDLPATTRPTLKLPGSSPPPPRAGDTLTLPFPPPATSTAATEATAAPAAKADPVLRVLRHTPEGDVTAASHLSVTFSTPLRVLSGHGDDPAPPLAIHPQPPGRFRWLGTRTLRFDAEGRFPMATRFSVTVPAGTRADNGATLANAHTFAFQTPPPRLVHSHPNDASPSTRSPVIVLGFDQRIDPAAMLDHVTLRGGDTAFTLRPATEAELAADPDARAVLDAALPETAMALVPSQPLPQALRARVVVREGAPSAEGPLRTTAEQGFAVRTHGPLRVQQSGCDGGCPPEHGGLGIQMSNPLDEARFDATLLRVSPAIEGMQITAAGHSLLVTGALVGRQRYTVTLPPGLRDVFGQTLGTQTEVVLETAAAQPGLFSDGGALITLQPGRAVLPVRSVNLPEMHVDIQRVEPKDWGAFATWQGLRKAQDAPVGPAAPALPGVKRFSGALRPDGRVDAPVDTAIDLTPYLDDGRGHLIVRIAASFTQYGHPRHVEYLHWVQVTETGVVAWMDGEKLVAWATRLSDGAPLPGAALSLSPAGGGTTTDDDGIAELPLPRGDGEAIALHLRHGEDVALLPRLAFRHRDREGFRAAKAVTAADAPLRFYTFDDRGLYKAGETAHVKGYVRRIGHGPRGDVMPAGARPRRLDWTLRGPRGNQLGTGTTEVSDHGSFDVTLALPDTMNLGHAALVLSAGASDSAVLHHHALRVEAFRRPEFEVQTTATRSDVLADETASVEVSARYFAGGALAGAALRWEVGATEAWFRPPNHDDFHFGRHRVWFWDGDVPGPSAHASLETRTDDAGNHRLGLRLGGAPFWQPMRVDAVAMVSDDNRQTFDGAAALTLHPAAAYPGLRAGQNFVGKDEDILVDTVAVALDGTRATGLPVSLTRYRLVDTRVDGAWTQTRTDAGQCDLRSTIDPQACRFGPTEPGAYAIEATLRDAAGRESRSEVRVWVSGQPAAVAARSELQRVRIVPDRMRYAPGETARLLLQAPFQPAHAVLTYERDGILQREHFEMPTGSHVVELPITDAHVPGVTAHVELVGSEPTTNGNTRLPAHASGQLHLEVPPLPRTLRVAVAPVKAELLPGARTAVDIDVRDAQGAPLRDAELAVAIVDEALLTLADYQRPDPLGVFYAARPDGVTTLRQRDQLLLPSGQRGGRTAGGRPVFALEGPTAATPMQFSMEESAMGGSVRARTVALAAGPSGGGPGAAVALRERFEASVLFAPAVRTDARGHARVPLTLPDSLTRYRVTVVAVDRTRSFGVGEASVRASLPLMVRPSPPRFANFGDRFELPILVQNRGEQAAEVSLAVRASGAHLGASLSAFDDPGAGSDVRGVRVTVPPGDRVEVRVPTATPTAGEARFQVVVAAADGRGDAAEVAFPVYTPATSEAFAAYGELTANAVVQPVAAPPDVLREFGGLSVTTSSTRLQVLTDALLYLTTYPFECNEQLASRLLSVLALHDVLRAFDASDLPPPAALEASVKESLAQLLRRQAPDGGFGFWSAERGSDPYVSVHVTRALLRAKRQGHAVDADALERALRYLTYIEQRLPTEMAQPSRLAVQAYAIEVLRLHGMPAGDRALSLWRKHAATLPPEAAAWLLPTLHDAGFAQAAAAVRRDLGNRIVETAAAAHVASAVTDGAQLILHSDRRTDAVVLAALLHTEAESELPGKLVEGLLGHRTRGRWRNTQENAFVLLALRAYFDAREAELPRFLSRVWLGDSLVGQHRFVGRSTDRVTLNVPMANLTQTPSALTLGRTGRGRMYYRLGMRYAPANLAPSPADHGFAVTRSYAPVDDPDDVTRLPDGRWRIRAGARVRVELAFVAESERHHVALLDPLPAGLEIAAGAQATSDPGPPIPLLRGPGRTVASRPRPPWRRPGWYEHQNLRDDRAEAFSSRLPAGDYTYSYVARATIPGRFVVPPARAEEMYAPETFGRSAADQVVIE